MTTSKDILNNKEVLSAGVSLTDITPPVGALMNGDFFPHTIHDIHDPLYAKATVIKSGQTCIAIVIVDTCCFAEEFLAPVRVEINRVTAIPLTNILIAATHTHSGGSPTEIFLTPVDQEYASKLAKALVSVVADALAAIVPCKIAYGSIDVSDHVVSRRYRMAEGIIPFNPFGKTNDKVATNPFGFEGVIADSQGAVDPGLSFLAIQSLGNEWMGLVANYSLHYVGDLPVGTVSADYFGFFARAIGEKLNAPENFVAMLSNGSSGNVNIWDFLSPNRYPSGDYEKSRFIANDLATRIAAVLPDLEWQTDITIATVHRNLKIPVRMPSASQLAKAQQKLKGVNFDRFTSFDTENLPLVYAYEQLQLAKEPDESNVPLQLFKVGELFIGAVPGELFAETGLALKRIFAPRNFFAICLANGNVGYIPPAHEMELGGYETWRSRASKLIASAESTIVSAIEELGLQLQEGSTAIRPRQPFS